MKREYVDSIQEDVMVRFDWEIEYTMLPIIEMFYDYAVMLIKKAMLMSVIYQQRKYEYRGTLTEPERKVPIEIVQKKTHSI